MLTALSLVDQPVSMWVYKHSGDVTLLFFNPLQAQSFRDTKKDILSTNNIYQKKRKYAKKNRPLLSKILNRPPASEIQNRPLASKFLTQPQVSKIQSRQIQIQTPQKCPKISNPPQVSKISKRSQGFKISNRGQEGSKLLKRAALISKI